MHIAFINPQGNFDSRDSYLAEHPDFGGQLVYVKEVAIAMAEQGHRVDIVTRQVDDPEWPEFVCQTDYYVDCPGNPRILRIPCGGKRFLPKEQLWPHLEEFTDNLLAYYADERPDFVASHYADGGYCATLLLKKAGLGFTFTGHSLGAQKLDKLGTSLQNLEAMESRFHFSSRIEAERLAMQHASKIITSTNQERQEQYAHPLYLGAVDVINDDKFSVIPPGVNLKVFNREIQPHDATYRKKLDIKLSGKQWPWVVVSSRLDEKKNIIGVVQAYANNSSLQQKCGLVICIRGIDDPFGEIGSLSEGEQKVLQPILEQIDSAQLRDNVIFLNIQSQQELASTYRFFAESGSVFALTAFYEPFGLAPIEAAACGLVCVATRNGGPSEIFEDGSGVLVDPFDPGDIALGLDTALDNALYLSGKAYERVINKYTWNKTAAGYIRAIQESRCLDRGSANFDTSLLDAVRIEGYLSTRPV